MICLSINFATESAHLVSLLFVFLPELEEEGVPVSEIFLKIERYIHYIFQHDKNIVPPGIEFSYVEQGLLSKMPAANKLLPHPHTFFVR